MMREGLQPDEEEIKGEMTSLDTLRRYAYQLLWDRMDILREGRSEYGLKDAAHDALHESGIDMGELIQLLAQSPIRLKDISSLEGIDENQWKGRLHKNSGIKDIIYLMLGEFLAYDLRMYAQENPPGTIEDQ